VFHQVHGRSQQCGSIAIFLEGRKQISIFSQWSYGGLDTATMMALIEASTLEGDDQKMQKGINAIDKCSQIS
jgi:hypothetical protein